MGHGKGIQIMHLDRLVDAAGQQPGAGLVEEHARHRFLMGMDRMYQRPVFGEVP